MKLHNILSVTEDGEVGVYIASVEITDNSEDRYVTDYVSRESDVFGLAPAVREAINQWIADGKTIDPYVEPEPPTPEEIRASMPSLTARQLRLGLVGGGFSLAQVAAAIAAIPDEQQRAVAAIEWEYATQFERLHPLIAQVGGTLGLSPEQIDAMWTAAMDL